MCVSFEMFCMLTGNSGDRNLGFCKYIACSVAGTQIEMRKLIGEHVSVIIDLTGDLLSLTSKRTRISKKFIPNL